MTVVIEEFIRINKLFKPDNFFLLLFQFFYHIY